MNNRKFLTVKGFLSAILSVVLLFGCVFSAGFSSVAAEPELTIGQSTQIIEKGLKTSDKLYKYNKVYTKTRLEDNGLGEPQYECTDGYIEITAFLGAKTLDEATREVNPLPMVTNAAVPETIDTFPVVRIGSSAFKDNELIKSARIPATVTEIGNSCFDGCEAFENLVIQSEDTVIGTNALPGIVAGDFEYIKYTLEIGLDEHHIAEVKKYVKPQNTVIDPETGEEAPEMIDLVEVPDVIEFNDSYTVASIGPEAFLNREDIVEVDFTGDVITSIKDRAFSGCTNMNMIKMGDGVKTIGDYAFYQCTSLQQFHFSDKLVTIGDSAFERCTAFKGNTEEREVTFHKKENNQIVDDVQMVNALILPSSVREIGSGAFSGCVGLQCVNINEGVTVIRTGTFESCSELKIVDLPSTLMNIELAFSDAFTSHNNTSDYIPQIYIRSPHVVFDAIETYKDCEKLGWDKHLEFHAVKYSAVYAFVDLLNEYYEYAILGEEGSMIGELVKPHVVSFYPIDVPGHTFTGIVTAPTCTEIGYTTYSCNCGFKDKEGNTPYYIADKVKALGHDYGEWVISPGMDSTCTQVGTKTRTCKREGCGDVHYGQIEPKGHAFRQFVTATCTEAGAVWDECIRCHTKKNLKSYPLGLGHDWQVIEEVSTYIQCEQNGEYIYECTICTKQKTAIQRMHPDENNDYYCDICGVYAGTSDLTDDKTCTCDCHKQVGIKAILGRLRIFVWRIFGTNQVCECGVMHYEKPLLSL